MKAFLWFVSLLLLSLPCAAQTDDNVEQKQFSMGIQARGNNISGIAIMEPSDDGGTVGTIVNEFGVKVLDFTYAGGKTTIMNVIAPLNKWYIRKVLRKDVGLILQHLGHAAEGTEPLGSKRTVTHHADGGLTLSNQRYKIVYTLSPMKETNEPQ